MMVIPEQVEAMLDFLEGQPDLVHGHLSRTLEGRNLSARLWSKCAKTLNSVNETCPTKSPQGWRSFYNEYKHKLYKKVKAKQQAAKDDPPRNVILTPLQKRLHNMLVTEDWDVMVQENSDPLALTEGIDTSVKKITMLAKTSSKKPVTTMKNESQDTQTLAPLWVAKPPSSTTDQSKENTTQTDQPTPNTNNTDSDMSFLLGILPEMQSMTPKQKMEFKSGIWKLIMDIRFK